jgi:hypothetical protein
VNGGLRRFRIVDKRNVLCCDIAEMATNPRRPAGCDPEWGHAFEPAKGNGTRLLLPRPPVARHSGA